MGPVVDRETSSSGGHECFQTYDDGQGHCGREDGLQTLGYERNGKVVAAGPLVPNNFM
jgi:hypothetical protein